MPFDVERVRGRLAGRRIEWAASRDSTMTDATRLARQGCAHGTIVGADRQTAGMGRQGRAWHSEPEAGLYVSFVLRPATQVPVLMLALGLAARSAIAGITGLAPDLRWPNDVLLRGKKCAGILAQVERDAVIAGIGINVDHASFPEEIAGTATSLRIEGARVRREDLLTALASAIDEYTALNTPDILDCFARSSSYVHGRRVTVDQDNAVLSGVTCGLDPAGFLRLRQDNGVEITILAGGVRPV